MERNTNTLYDAAAVARAGLRVYDITVALRLPRWQMELMFKTDVFDLLTTVAGPSDLRAYADGLLAGHVQAILRSQCEFVYRLTERKGADDVEVRVFGLQVHGPHQHYSRMTMGERSRAECGYAWKDSDGLTDFGEFEADKTLEGL